MTFSSFEKHVQKILDMINLFLKQIAHHEEINLDPLEPLIQTLEEFFKESSSLMTSPLVQELHSKLALLTETLQKEQKMIHKELDSLNHHSQGIGQYILNQHLSST